MSILQAHHSSQQEQDASPPDKHSFWRLATLCIAMVLLIGTSVLLRVEIVQWQIGGSPIIMTWFISFLPYLACSVLILATRPQSGRRRWTELAVIMLGALIMRAILLPVPPYFSRDAWRYLWDARVTLHGYSPYVTIPNSPQLAPLHDSLIYGHMDYRTFPTLYPPAAQTIYIISYVIAPSNLFMLKGIFMLFDLVTCGTLAFLLQRKGLDPARCLIYAWCPLPIVEFAIQGHIDVVMVTFITLMFVCAQGSWRGARILTGVLLGLATLTKLYPIILLVAVMRRQDYLLVLSCGATIAIGYLPYYILGHGQVFGFFAQYLSQGGINAGPILLSLTWLGHFSLVSKDLYSHLASLIEIGLVGFIALTVLLLRWREHISIEAATLLLLGAIFSISTHIYPWYITVLLPCITLLVGPLLQRRANKRLEINTRSLAVIAAWYFICTAISSYWNKWAIYYILIYDVIFVLLIGAALIAIIQWRSRIYNKNMHR